MIRKISASCAHDMCLVTALQVERCRTDNVTAVQMQRIAAHGTRLRPFVSENSDQSFVPLVLKRILDKARAMQLEPCQLRLLEFFRQMPCLKRP